MTPEAQRIAIAEACGLKDVRLFHGVLIHGSGKLFGALQHAVPDYLNNLDAMHEAENVLSAAESARCYGILANIVAPTSVLSGSSGYHHICFKVAHATAAQRAEAFLRTIGKWEE